MVSYFLQDIDFVFKHKRLNNSWLKLVAESEIKKLGNINIIFCSDNYILDVNVKYLAHEIAAAGRPNTVTADMVKSGAVVIDVGVNRIPDSTKKSGFHLAGDVDFNAVKDVASYITPVPKGVGPMTIAMLIYNTLEAAENTLTKA